MATYTQAPPHLFPSPLKKFQAGKDTARESAVSPKWAEIAATVVIAPREAHLSLR
jgi:hypothetical protein